MSLIGGGHNFMSSMSRSFMEKILRKPSKVHKVMRLCANWHSSGVKGFLENNFRGPF